MKEMDGQHGIQKVKQVIEIRICLVISYVWYEMLLYNQSWTGIYT